MTDEEMIKGAIEHARRDGIYITEEEAREQLESLRRRGLITNQGITADGQHYLDRRRVEARMSGGFFPSQD